MPGYFQYPNWGLILKIESRRFLGIIWMMRGMQITMPACDGPTPSLLRTPGNARSTLVCVALAEAGSK